MKKFSELSCFHLSSSSYCTPPGTVPVEDDGLRSPAFSPYAFAGAGPFAEGADGASRGMELRRTVRGIGRMARIGVAAPLAGLVYTQSAVSIQLYAATFGGCLHLPLGQWLASRLTSRQRRRCRRERSQVMLPAPCTPFGRAPGIVRTPRQCWRSSVPAGAPAVWPRCAGPTPAGSVCR
jgi:hypothetical protein